jgi:hypothetical protein
MCSLPWKGSASMWKSGKAANSPSYSAAPRRVRILVRPHRMPRYPFEPLRSRTWPTVSLWAAMR